MKVLVTGGAGFIGSHFIDQMYSEDIDGNDSVVCLDLLTYAGKMVNIEQHSERENFTFEKGDIGDQALVSKLLRDHEIDWVVNFAAETHVDRSITGPDAFIQTNIVGTHELLKACLNYFNGLDKERKDAFRFLHVSTDEVYGSLGPDDAPFTEESIYQPNSPYSASKAASDHLVRAYHHTFGLPTLITNCSNNYGPRQDTEKLIPLMITNALAGKPLPIYGDGLNVRDWLYVKDHCTAVLLVLQKGAPGETFNIGGNCEKTNIEIVDVICKILDRMNPIADGTSYSKLKSFVGDRPGHDRRYGIDSRKIQNDLGWAEGLVFEQGIKDTIANYIR
tara:strand:+ start:4882 stop:5883 length:1002 start_codon:yes stop_codon:yes gene_type:complete